MIPSDGPSEAAATCSSGWLDRDRYPFGSRWADLPGGRLHYVDEGEGDPVVMLHGNPTWSFLYRHLVAGLGDEYRCIAPDLLGFGLSEAPAEFPHRPDAHARTIGRLVDALDLADVTLVAHDWGGPIGLDVATRRPRVVAGLVAMNTWMWPRDALRSRAIARAVGTRAGRRLVLRHNAFARTALLPFRWRSPAVYRHYVAPFAAPRDRIGSWALARHVAASREWLGRLWDRRAAVADLPALFLWGARDPLHAPLLSRWRATFERATTRVYRDVGHFVPEAVGPALVRPVRRFLEAR